MPLFLSSPTTKPARAKLQVPDKTQAKAPARPREGRGLVWLWLVLGLLLCAGLGVGWFFGTRALRAQLVARHPVPTGNKAICMDAFHSAPWLTDADIAELTKDMGSLLTADPLDGHCLQQVAQRLRGHPAIEAVTRVYRDDKGMVHIEARAHQPAGMVPTGDLFTPINAKGQRLSGNDLSTELAAKLPIPRIDGVKAPAPYGEDVWNDAGLQAALQLILRLDAQERRCVRTLAIHDESGPKDTRRTILTLKFEAPNLPPFEVLWGLPIGQEKGVDAPPEEKLNALRGLYSRLRAFKDVSSLRFSIRSGNATQLKADDSKPSPHPAGKTGSP